MLLTTTENIPGRSYEIIGIAKGNMVQSKNIGRDIGQGLKSMVGGELTTYSEMMNESRAAATKRMVEDAERMGADAVVMMRYSTSSIAAGAAEVIAYGTAVRFVRRGSPHILIPSPRCTRHGINRHDGGVRMTETRVGLVGACGKMGTMLVRRVLATEGMTISSAFDLVNVGKDIGEVAGVGAIGVPVADPKDLAGTLKSTGTDVLLDFTVAAATAVNAPAAASAGVNLVIGTTGLSDEQRAAIVKAVEDNGVAAVISTNYSIGVAVFNKLIRRAAELLGDDYDVEIVEAHHNQKRDAPSGTAMTAAEIISEAMGGKDLVYGRQGQCPRGKEIGIHSIRGGDIVGDHTVMFIGNSERIEIRHQAHSREIFVGGAVMAAGWVVDQPKGRVYSMTDVMGERDSRVAR